jgi:hypothetical protein
MGRITRWGWAGIAAAGAVLLWVWTQYANDPGDTSWTDPHQPPDMLPPLLGASSGRILRPEPYCRTYPGSLAGWDGTVVGDC